MNAADKYDVIVLGSGTGGKLTFLLGDERRARSK